MASGINKIGLLVNPTKLMAEVKRRKQIKKFKPKIVRIGHNVNINKSKVGNHTFIGNGTKLIMSALGDHSYINSNTSVINTVIGKYTSIGSNVILGLGEHPTNLVSTHPAFYSNNKPYLTYSDKNYFEEYKNITLGNDVWIGLNAIIMGGVIIGDGAIVAAGAIVTKDVEPYSVVGGIPAKHIKYRIPEEFIDKILKTKWWDKNDKWLAAHYNLFFDPEKFISFFEDK